MGAARGASAAANDTATTPASISAAATAGLAPIPAAPAPELASGRQPADTPRPASGCLQCHGRFCIHQRRVSELFHSAHGDATGPADAQTGDPRPASGPVPGSTGPAAGCLWAASDAAAVPGMASATEPARNCRAKRCGGWRAACAANAPTRSVAATAPAHETASGDAAANGPAGTSPCGAAAQPAFHCIKRCPRHTSSSPAGDAA